MPIWKSGGKPVKMPIIKCDNKPVDMPEFKMEKIPYLKDIFDRFDDKKNQDGKKIKEVIIHKTSAVGPTTEFDNNVEIIYED